MIDEDNLLIQGSSHDILENSSENNDPLDNLLTTDDTDESKWQNLKKWFDENNYLILLRIRTSTTGRWNLCNNRIKHSKVIYGTEFTTKNSHF